MTFDDAARARIARGWSSTPLDQPTYAAQHGISERTLREWARRFGAGRRPAARTRAIIESAIAQLQALRTALDAEDACHIGAADNLAALADRDCEERHAAAAEQASTLPATPVASQACLAGAAERIQASDAEEVGRSGVAAAAPVDRLDGAAEVAPDRAEPPDGPSHPRNDTPCVVDIEALRRRAAQAREGRARAATGTPKRQPFDWDAE